MNTTQTRPAPDPPRMDLAIPVSGRVQIQNVRLVQCNCRVEPSALTPPHPGTFRASFGQSVSTQVAPDGPRIAVIVRFQFSAVREGSGTDEPCVRIGATFLVSYMAESLAGLGAEHFNSFGAFNGVFNAWPYWRELLHNLTSRMGLPAFILPVLRIGSPERSDAAAMQPPDDATKMGRAPDPSPES